MIKTNLIINFCKPSELLAFISKQNMNAENTLIVDIPGTLFNLNGIAIYNPMVDDVDFAVQKKSHHVLAKKIGKLAKQFGKYNIDGLSLFWQTNMAEKHDYYSVHGKVTYFELLLESNKKLFNLIIESEKLYVTLPENSSSQTHRLVKQLIKQKCHATQTQSNYKRIKFLKYRLRNQYIFLKKAIQILFHKRFSGVSISNLKSRTVSAPIIFLTRGKTANKQKPEHILLQKLGSNIDTINLLETLESNFSKDKVFSSNAGLQESFVAAKPSKKQVFLIIVKVIYLKSLFFFQGLFRANKGSEFVHCAKREMSRVLMNFDGLMLYKWYKNYFSNVSGQRLFLITDEFYKTGRLICNAKKSSQNKNIKIVGIQHGMFGEAHTVYKISDFEIKGNLPIPDHFIVWGEFFRTFFTKFNTLPKDYVQIASYLDFEDSKFKEVKSKKKRILWCTTLPEIALFDFNLLIQLPDIDNYEIVLKQHPNFNVTEFIERNITKGNELWARIKLDKSETINQAIQSSVVVLTSSPSTVILDSLLNKTPVLYSDCGYRICDFKNNYDAGIYIVRTIEDFKIYFTKAIKQKGKINDSFLNYYVNKKSSFENVLKSLMP